MERNEYRQPRLRRRTSKGSDPRHRPFYATGGPKPKPLFSAGGYNSALGRNFALSGDGDALAQELPQEDELLEALMAHYDPVKTLRAQADWGRRVAAGNPAYGSNLWYTIGNVLAPSAMAHIKSQRKRGER